MLRGLAFCLLIAVSPLGAQCLGGSQPCNVVGIGPVFDGSGGPFLSGQTYVISGPVTVPTGMVLTIQPGAVVKFAPDGSLPFSIWVDGRILAVGTAGSPVVFTSYRDDSAGGDTNGDGNSTVPTPGDWKGIGLASWSGTPQANSFAWCEFRYAGKTQFPTIQVDTSAASFDQCSISDGGGDGIRPQGAAKPMITGCSFVNCQRAITRVSLNGVANLANNTAMGCSQGDDYLEVWLDGGSIQISGQPTWSAVNTLNQSGVLVMAASVQVPAAESLTLVAGMILKFTNAGQIFSVLGNLTTLGTSGNPVVLTAIEDDAYGGDTNVNGAVAPLPGSWKGLHFSSQAGASSLLQTVVRFGGSQVPAAVDVQGANISMTAVTVDGSSSAGLNVVGAQPTVTSCNFINNAQAVAQIPIGAITGFTNNQASGNTTSDALAIGGGTLWGSLTLGPANALGGGALVLAGDIIIGGTGSLTLQPGTVLKASGPRQIAVDGVLSAMGTAGQPVVLTSIHDDAYGGDTNKNGGATSAGPGDWKGLVFTPSSDASQLVSARIRYAGATGVPAIGLQQADIQITGSQVTASAGPALHLYNQSLPTVSGCSFDQGAENPVQAVAFSALAGFSANTASGNIGGDYLSLASSTINVPVTLDVASTLNQSGVYVFSGTPSVGASGVLTLGAGVIIKIDGNHDVGVAGSLQCPNGPVTVTSIADDAVGGDTANDGPSAGSSGDWGWINFSGNIGSTLSGVTLRFGGSGNRPTIQVTGSNVSLDGCTIAYGQGAALGVAPSGQTTVTNCAFDQNQAALDPVAFDRLTGFSGNTASGNAAGDVMRISGIGAAPVTVTPAMSLNGTGVFVMEASTATSNGQVVTLTAGTILKWNGAYGLSILGSLFCQGTAANPVVMTSIHDDTWGGDTNGAPTAPQPGDWIGLIFASASDVSVLQHTIIRYAGHGGNAAVELFGADVTLEEVTIEKSAGPGIDANGSSAPTIIGGEISCNGGLPIAGMTWATLGNISGVNAYGNAGGDLTVIDSSLVVGDLVIRAHSYFGDAVVVNVTPAVSLGNTLTFQPGCILKAGNSSVEFPFKYGGGVNGTATDPVVFTSLYDDAYGGDTNGDGSATVPQPGDWPGLDCAGSVDHALVRYAGATGVAGLRTIGGQYRSCRVEYALDRGFEGGGLFSNCIAFQNGGDGFFLETGTLAWCTSAANGGLGVDGTVGNIVLATNSWANVAGNFPSLTPGYSSVSSPLEWRILYSNGTLLGPCLPPVPMWGLCHLYGHGNIDTDPQFMDLNGGDLRLQATSPLIDAVPTAENFQPYGNQSFFIWDALYQILTFDAQDHADHPRILDHDLGGPGPFLADIGAYERSPFRLAVSGQPEKGTTMTFSPQGPAGVGIVVLCLDPAGGAPIYVAPVGFFLGGDLALTLILGTSASFGSVPLYIPDVALLDGFRFAVQALTAESASGRTVLTNVYLGEIF